MQRNPPDEKINRMGQPRRLEVAEIEREGEQMGPAVVLNGEGVWRAVDAAGVSHFGRGVVRRVVVRARTRVVRHSILGGVHTLLAAHC